MVRNIINANSKCIGKVIIESSCIFIINSSKPLIILFDPRVLKLIESKDPDGILILYDFYTLTIFEIAALYEMRYFKMAQMIKDLNPTSSMKAGRRNSSYRLDFSEERKNHMKKSQLGLKKPRPNYIMPLELRQQISSKLKEGYRIGRIVIDREKRS